MLTSEQISYFETFGFLVLRNAFSSEETNLITKEADQVWKHTQGRDTDSGHTEVGKQISGFIEMNTVLTNLIADDRVYVAVEQLLGPGFTYVASDGNMWAGDTVWHSDDNIRPGYKRVKIALYLDPLTRKNGCLRVVPGSHLYPFHKGLKKVFQADQNPFGLVPEMVPSFPIETNPGDILMFCHDIMHASFGAHQLRRQIALSFFAKPEVDEHKKWVVGLYSEIRKKSDELTAKSFLDNPNPRIQNVVAPLKSLGVE
jgi:ectoine hydroxylase-related dioxygenase (phytanoyl-CoA dioxygenase family)